MKFISTAILITLLFSLGYLMFGKLGIPDGMTAVTPFDLKRFEGTWYEIARLDHGFEKNMSHVAYSYTLKEGGGFTVENKAFDTKSAQWQTSSGKGDLIDDANVGRLKISYFGPFYGSFNIIALDEKNYNWAMVTGPNARYFWILSRQKTLDNVVMQELVRKAVGLGFKLERMIQVDQKDETAIVGNPLPVKAPN
jgi:apolipoprotein D and lipocalin family protein